MKRIVIIGISFCLFSCGEREIVESKDVKTTTTETKKDVVEDSTQSKKEIAQQIVKLLIEKDFQELTGYFYQDSILVAPYAFIEENPLKLSASEFLDASENAIVWGTQDGSGEQIKMLSHDFLDKYLIPINYLEKENIQFRENEFIGAGNSLNNLKSVFPNNNFVEYYFPGTEEFDYMDWKALRIVFAKEKNKIVALISDRWTI